MSPLSSPDSAVPSAELRHWRNSLFVVFAFSGLAMATWASRLPAIRATLDIGTDQLGLVILAMSIGSVIGITQAPSFIHRWGLRSSMRAFMLLVLLGVAG
ncbi:MAG: MFS transporter, partial [Mycetocola sp.]